MRRIRRLSLAAGLTVLFLGAALGIAVSPAGAHHPVLSGAPSCPAADHVIDWSIGNTQAKEAMTVVSAVAVLSAKNYPVTGYQNPIPPAGTTAAQSVIPGKLHGTVTITVKGHWPDGHHAIRSADVVLVAPCPSATTVPTTPSTTPPTTPTTVKSGIPPVAPSTTPTSSGGGSVTPPAPQLAFTGGANVALILIGIGLVLFGAAILFLHPIQRSWKSRRA